MLPPPLSLINPIADADNCIIEFDSETGVTIDDNGFPMITATATQLRARVYSDENTPGKADVFPPGTDLNGELLWGRLHSPVTFPAGIVDLSIVRITFDGGRSGTARIKIKTQNNILGTNHVLGQRFHLLFREN